MSESRIPLKVEKSLGEDRVIHTVIRPPVSHQKLCDVVAPLQDIARTLVDAGWNVLKPFTVTTCVDKSVEVEAVLTRCKPAGTARSEP